MARLLMDIWTSKKRALGALMLGALPAIADEGGREFACLFPTECVDAECAESGYEAGFRLLPSDGELSVGVWEDPSETLEMTGIDGAAIQMTWSEVDRPWRLLTIGTDGAARYTTQIADPPMAITYIGRCEEAT